MPNLSVYLPNHKALQLLLFCADSNELAHKRREPWSYMLAISKEIRADPDTSSRKGKRCNERSVQQLCMCSCGLAAAPWQSSEVCRASKLDPLVPLGKVA